MTSNERTRRAARGWRCSSRPAKAGRGDRAQRGGRGAGLDDDSVDADQAQSPTPPPPYGACHRAGHFGPDPLAWSPSPAIAGAENKFVLAARLRPSFASQRSRNETTLLDPPPEQQGGGAPKGAPSIGRIAADKSAQCAQPSADAAAARAGAARLPALRGSACRSERTLQLSPGRASRDQEDAGVTRAVDRA